MKKAFLKSLTIIVVLGLAAGPALASRDGLVAPGIDYVDDYTLRGPVNFATGIDPADGTGDINVIVEIPSGTTGKWEVSTDTGNIVWEFKKGKPRTVDYMGGYPVNYGTVPKTILSQELGGEGESVDVVLFGAQQKRGAVVKAKLIGVLKMQEGDGALDDKLLAVAVGTPEYAVKDVSELDQKFGGIARKVESWFLNYKGADSGMISRGFGTPEEATRLFYATMKAYREKM